MKKTKVILWQCARCNWLVWKDRDAHPRCEKCESYQTVPVQAGHNGRGSPPEFEIEVPE